MGRAIRFCGIWRMKGMVGVCENDECWMLEYWRLENTPLLIGIDLSRLYYCMHFRHLTLKMLQYLASAE